MSLNQLYDDAKAVWHFNNAWTDAKGTHNIANTGAIFDGSIKQLGSHSAKWDGSNDVGVVTDHADFKQDVFAMSWWNYVPSLGQRNGLISKHNTINKTGWFVTINPSNNIIFSAGDGVSFPAYTASYGISAIGWYHIIIVHSLTVHKLYVNGVLRASVAGGAMAHQAISLWFGRDKQTAAYAIMQSDETNYWTRVLTDGGISVGQLATGEIAELHNLGAGVQLGIDVDPVVNGIVHPSIPIISPLSTPAKTPIVIPGGNASNIWTTS